MAGNRLGLCSLALIDRPLPEVLRIARSAGFDGIELTARAPHFDSRDGAAAAAAIARQVRDAQLEMIAYGSYLGHAPLLEQRHAEREVEIAIALGAPLLRAWVAGEDFERTVAVLRHAADAAAPHRIEVVVERHVGSFADTEPRVGALLDAVARDNVALNYQPLDDMPGSAVAGLPAECARLAPRSRYMHVKNYHPAPAPDAGVRPFAPIDTGVIDWPAVITAARAAGFAGPVSLEFSGATGDAAEAAVVAAAAYLRSLLA